MTQRYKVIEGSQSAHCCFEATVVDTHAPPVLIRKDGEVLYRTICECFDFEDAELICDLLNGIAAEEKQSQRDMQILFDDVNQLKHDLTRTMYRVTDVATRVAQLEA